MDAPTNQQRNVLIAVVAVVAAVAIALAVVVVDGGDDDTTTTTSPSTTTTTAAPSTTTTVPPGDLAIAAFPDLTTGARYTDPVEVARAFATELLGFRDDVVVGELQQGDSRSGEVQVHPAATSAITTVLVRQISDDSWVALGAGTDTIVLDAPLAGSKVASPEPLRGAASAYEGNVIVRLLRDGSTQPVATTFVTGRGDGTLGPFTGELTFTVPKGVSRGLLVLVAPNGEDSSTNAALAIRIGF